MTPPIPKLPGYTVCLPQSLSDKGFKKGQTLTYLNGYQREETIALVKEVGGEGSPNPGSPSMSAMQQGTATLSASMLRGDSPSKLPKWVENDRKVLRFYGYFKEAVVESNVENHRVRKVVLYYYLEDDSLHVAEPRQDNSGIPQGVFIKRHKAAKEGGGFFTPVDFSVGEPVTVYGRTFHLVDCDTFTREFYTANYNKEQGSPEPYPDDPIDTYRTTFGMDKGRSTNVSPGTTTTRLNDFKAYIEARLGKPSHLLEGDKLRQFLENNKRVLRFWCVWDDRTNMYGDRRPYVLHYYLEDDTVEILEVNENNSGRDPFPIFLRRAALPKVPVKTNTTLNPKYRKEQCYNPGDFRLGTYITVLNRDFYLHDCDTFTKNWYKDNLGFGDEELSTVDVKEPIVPRPRPAVPPYNGYGTIEDSLQNCLSLVPKPPKRDLHKLMNKDKIILRFVVRMIETDTHKHSPTDLARRFILSYYMMDDSMLIFEVPQRNSGIAGGKFLERQKIYKPKSEDIYTYLDLYVGGTLLVFNRTFELMEADEYTLTYMENYKDIFIMADTDLLVKSLKAQVAGREEAVRTAFIAQDKAGSGQLTSDELEAALLQAGLKFTRHQAIALQRRLSRSGSVSVEEILNLLGISNQ